MKAPPVWAQSLMTALASFAHDRREWRGPNRTLAAEILARLPVSAGYRSVNWQSLIGNLHYLSPLAEARGIDLTFDENFMACVVLRANPAQRAEG
jgi:hypothetical protein